MKFQPEYSPRFKRAFKKLGAKDQKDVKSTIAAMLDDPNQPLLRTKRIQNAKSIKPYVYEAGANGNIRISWQFLDPLSDGTHIIYFRNVGNHDLTLKKP